MRKKLGNGRLMTSIPPLSGSVIGTPSLSTISISTPGNGLPTLPGLTFIIGIVPRHGPPVSVCHQLSTMYPHLPLPQRCS